MFKVALTGKPRSGKTSMVIKLAEYLKNNGVNPSGFYTREVKRYGQRTGFEVVDVSDSTNKGVFADIEMSSDKRVGKYGLDLDLFETIGVSAMQEGLKKRLPLIVDEVGPMELKSSPFRKTLSEILSYNDGHNSYAYNKKAGKNLPLLIFTVHYKANDSPVQRIKDNFILYEITTQNKDEVFESVKSNILENI